jgi:AhpD family alkylhydroperoxidase
MGMMIVRHKVRDYGQGAVAVPNETDWGGFAMSKDFVQIADDVISGVRLLREGAPDLMTFGAVATAATTSKAIDTKTKELMALAIGIAVHCDGCVAFHTKMAHQNRATREAEEMRSAPMINSAARRRNEVLSCETLASVMFRLCNKAARMSALGSIVLQNSTRCSDLRIIESRRTLF